MNLDLGHTRLIISKAEKRGVLRNQLAYLLATARWETNHTIEPVKEAYWLSEQWREDNLRYYPWYGRGFVQLTWDYNYKKADDKLSLGGSLIANPDRAMEPGIAADILVLGCMEGWFTGKKIPDYIDLQHSDFVNARRVVNGTDKASEIAEIAKDYDAALLDEGYGVELPPDPETPTKECDCTLAEMIATLAKKFGKKVS